MSDPDEEFEEDPFDLEYEEDDVEAEDLLILQDTLPGYVQMAYNILVMKHEEGQSIPYDLYEQALRTLKTYMRTKGA